MPLYHLDQGDHTDSRGPLTGEGGIMGTKFNQTTRDQGNNKNGHRENEND